MDAAAPQGSHPCKGFSFPHALCAGVLEQLRPGMSSKETWWDQWDPSAPASCNLLPQGGPSEAASSVGSSDSLSSMSLSSGQVLGGGGSVRVAEETASPAARGSSGAQPQGGRGEVCSMATLFLQHFLDESGSPSTFG